MNDIKTNCIDSRRNAIFASYNVKDSGTLKMIDDYFVKLEEFSKSCTDVMDFETKFSTSPLAKEYGDLFVLVMNSEPDINGNMPVNEVEEEYTIQDEIKDDINRGIRRRARQDIYNKARDIPVVGEALTAKQHFDFFSRFKKKDD